MPAPAYVVSDHGTVISFVFGEMDAPGATPRRYFHPSQLVWIARARASAGSGAEAQLQKTFCANFATALATLNLSTWRLADSVDDAGMPIAAGLQVRLDSARAYFLNGTSGLCVANPVAESQIAYKEVLQEKLARLSDHGKNAAYVHREWETMQELIAAYAAAAMPFSPIE